MQLEAFHVEVDHLHKASVQPEPKLLNKKKEGYFHFYSNLISPYMSHPIYDCKLPDVLQPGSHVASLHHVVLTRRFFSTCS